MGENHGYIYRRTFYAVFSAKKIKVGTLNKHSKKSPQYILGITRTAAHMDGQEKEELENIINSFTLPEPLDLLYLGYDDIEADLGNIFDDKVLAYVVNNKICWDVFCKSLSEIMSSYLRRKRHLIASDLLSQPVGDGVTIQEILEKWGLKNEVLNEVARRYIEI